jgi:hypothetical protein
MTSTEVSSRKAILDHARSKSRCSENLHLELHEGRRRLVGGMYPCRDRSEVCIGHRARHRGKRRSVLQLGTTIPNLLSTQMTG